MDFFHRNMDTIKGKLPQISNVPKLSKLKSRKIFSNSRDNLSTQLEDNHQPKTCTLQLPSPSGAVDLTPTHIGTISSLVDGAQQSNFNIPEEFIGRSPIGGRRRIRFSDSSSNNNLSEIGMKNDNQQSQQQHSQPASPNSPNENGNKTRFTEKLTRQYKELSEFKLSNLFSKKTVVRKTEIEVNTYLQGYQQDNGFDNRTYNHDESGFGSGMDASQDLYNRKRRISEVSNFDLSINSLPSGSDPSPLPKPKAALKMPPIPPAPERGTVKIVSPINEKQIQKENFVEEMKKQQQCVEHEEIPITAPLAKRKVFVQENQESFESVNMNDFEETTNKNKKNSTRKYRKERPSSTKSRKSITSNPGSIRSRNGSDKKNRGMWELKRPIRIKATEEDFKNPVDPNTLDSSPDFRKTLTGMFKKFQTNNSVDENDESVAPKPSAVQRIQKLGGNRTKSEPKIQPLPDYGEGCVFKKQFNKIMDNTGKLKNFIKNDNENNQPSCVPEDLADEISEKVKSIEEIEKLGYGRKNLKYIEMWKVRRRREIRRNEPFPINKADNNENNDSEAVKESEKETAEASQLAELKKSLSKVLKKRQLDREVSAESTTDDEPRQTEQQQGAKKGFGNLFKRQISKQTSISNEDNTEETDEQKAPFWKKSIKRKVQVDELAKSSDNLHNVDDNKAPKQESPKKVSLLNKAKSKVEKFKSTKKSSIDVNEPEKLPGKTDKLLINPANLANEFLNALDDVDEETKRAIEEMEKNSKCTNFNPPPPTATWQTNKTISGADFSSGSEESITTPGFLAHDNAPDSETYVSSEPTVIILSGPMPAFMTLQIEENTIGNTRPRSPSPFQVPREMEMLSAPNIAPRRSPIPTETLKNPTQNLRIPTPAQSRTETPVPEYFERPRSSSPIRFKTDDILDNSPIPPRSNLIKSAGFHDLASASLNSPMESPILGRRDYQSNTQPFSLSPSMPQRRTPSPSIAPPKETPPPLPSCSPPLLDMTTKIFPDIPLEFEDAIELNPEMNIPHKFNFKPDALQVILESPSSATNSLDVVELQLESSSTPPYSTPVQSPPALKRTTPTPKTVTAETSIPSLIPPTAKIHSQNDKIEANASAIPRPRHSRKPSMDKPQIQTAEIAKDILPRSPIVGINKIGGKNEETSQSGSEIVKKWSSVDIFNNNEEVFNDFDEALKNVPVIPIVIEKDQALFSANIKKKCENNNTSNIIREYKSMSPSLEKSSDFLMHEQENDDSDDEDDMNDIKLLNTENKIATSIPHISEKTKPTRPVVKQASLRRQFSDEKDAEDLNKNIDVNMLRSKFEGSNLPPRPPERMSFRKYEKVQVTTVIQDNESETFVVDNVTSKDFVITKNAEKQTIRTETPPPPPPLRARKESPIPPPIVPRKVKLTKQTTSLEVEDGSEASVGDVYEKIQDFNSFSNNSNKKEAIPSADVHLTSLATLKAIQAKQQYEAKLKADKTEDENSNSLSESSKIITSSLSDSVRNINADISIGKSSTAKILLHQQQHQLQQEYQKQKLFEQQHLEESKQQKDQMPTIQKPFYTQERNEISTTKTTTTEIIGNDINSNLVTKETDNPKTNSITMINNNNEPQVKSATTAPTNTNSNTQPDVNQIATTTTTGKDEGHCYSTTRIKLADIKKDETFYSLDDEEYQQYSLSGPTIVNELYTIEI
ncbi:uncharacterized protein LOC129618728 [Condylostylus longicornis]|uniref:uncharacterized protein LOC129618728 n=1 Tax=Condylostylus longicornis TaxID=2530218 RepID=UPI00244DFE2D|nr:uncharacterized protein LOC129618728 [Condylostylus longicornis]